MRLPKWITKWEIVMTGKGIYTPQITHDGSVSDKVAQDWISKHGKRLMESFYGQKIKRFRK